jgi:hypothetical protein
VSVNVGMCVGGWVGGWVGKDTAVTRGIQADGRQARAGISGRKM